MVLNREDLLKMVLKKAILQAFYIWNGKCYNKNIRGCGYYGGGS